MWKSFYFFLLFISAGLAWSQPIFVNGTLPSDTSLNEGDSLNIFVAAVGNGTVAYQWQDSSGSGIWTDIASGTSDTLKLGVVTYSDSGKYYRASGTDLDGASFSSVALLSVTNSVPSISNQPSDTTLLIGDTLQWVALANGYGTLTYQWQDSTNGGNWTNIASASGDTVTLDSVTAADSGRYLRYLVSDANDVVITNAALISVVASIAAPLIIGQPGDTTVTEGQLTSFSITYSGINSVVQWQIDSLANGSWTDIPGASDTSFGIAAALLANNGSLYRTIVSNVTGSDTSTPAILTVNALPPFSNWNGSLEFKLSTEKDWANVSEDVIGFPVLIRLDETIFDFALAKANGDDIRFATISDAALPFEIEYWNQSEKKGAAWVLIDTVKANASQKIKMYYGNAAAVSTSNGNAVFDTSNGFTSVWHLGEDGNTDSLGYKDATINAAHGTGQSFTVDSDTSGVIGMAQKFQKNSLNHIIIDTTKESLFDITKQITLSAWVKQSSTGTWPTIISKGDNTWRLATTTTQIPHFGANGSTGNWFDGAGSLTDGKWHLIVGVYDSTNFYMYLDGVQSPAKASTGLINVDDMRVLIGENSQATGRHWDGLIDEVRVSDYARSASWAKLSFENQKLNQSLVSKPIVPGCTPSFQVSSDTVNIAEMGSTNIIGTSNCALRSFWMDSDSNIISNSDSISYTSSRIVGDSSFTLIYKALFDTNTQSQEVVINVVENVPDPIFTIPAPIGVWTAQAPMVVSPLVSNLAAVLASSAPTINYSWSAWGMVVTRTSNSAKDYTLTNPRSDGTLNVSVCLDNGGAAVCDTVQIQVARILDVIELDKILDPIEFTSGEFKWNVPARLKIWNLNGEVLFDKTGIPGESTRISNQLRRHIRLHPNLLEIKKLGY